MCAIHLMTMKMAAQGIAHGYVNPRDAAITGKLARTFAQQMDTLNRVRGKVGKQSIKVRYERHGHRHVHVGEGGPEKGHKSSRQPTQLTAFRLANLRGAPRCLARTRCGNPCQQEAVRGKARCRMHGGGKALEGRQEPATGLGRTAARPTSARPSGGALRRC